MIRQLLRSKSNARPRSYRARLHIGALLTLCLVACGNERAWNAQVESAAEAPNATPDDNRSPLVVTRFSMGVRFQLAMLGADDHDLKSAANAAFAELDRLELLFNNWSEDSAVSHFNRSDKLEWQTVHSDLARIVHLALQFREPCRGAFDITLLPAFRAWGFLDQTGRRPSSQELSDLRLRTGMQRIEVRLEPPALRCLQQAVEIDLGALAKGYGVDRALEVLRAHGVSNAFLSAGGSTAYGLGPGPRGRGWPMDLGPSAELSDPTEPHSMRIWLRDEACATSGQGNNKLLVDGEEVGHILDPRSLLPIRSELESATCVTASAAEADIWATALVVLGPDKLEELMGPMQHSSQAKRWAVLFARDGSLHCAGQGPLGSELLEATERD